MALHGVHEASAPHWLHTGPFPSATASEYSAQVLGPLRQGFEQGPDSSLLTVHLARKLLANAGPVAFWENDWQSLGFLIIPLTLTTRSDLVLRVNLQG